MGMPGYPRECCKSKFGEPHIKPCDFDPSSGPIDYDGEVRVLHSYGPPIVDIALDRALRTGVAAQLRVLADVLDPPGSKEEG